MPKTKAPPVITTRQRDDGYIEVQVDGYTKFITRDPVAAHIQAKSYAPPPKRDDSALGRALRR
jgi:hypothetical protein